MQGGDCIYVVIFIIFSILFSYNLISYYFISKKSEYILLKKNKFYSKVKIVVFRNYFESISLKLINLSNPYSLNLKKYILIKYCCSTFLFIFTFIRDKSFVLSLLLFLIFYFLPNVLMYIYVKAESTKIINDISNIVQSQILSLSANMSLYEALKTSIKSAKYERFYYEYNKFINNYIMYNFNMSKAVYEFKEKFNSYEFNMFLSILLECEKEGNILENLEAFNKTLEFMNFKYLKIKSANRTVFISLATIISLINIFLIIVYPIAIQISQNLTDIFK